MTDASNPSQRPIPVSGSIEEIVAPFR
jgi:hypothetical protein